MNLDRRSIPSKHLPVHSLATGPRPAAFRAVVAYEEERSGSSDATE